MNELVQRVGVGDNSIFVLLLRPSVHADMYGALLRPNKARHFGAYRLGCVQSEQLPVRVRVLHRGRWDNVPGLIQSPIYQFPREYPELVKLLKRGHTRNFKNVL